MRVAQERDPPDSRESCLSLAARKSGLHEAERIVRDPKTPRCSDPDKLEEFLFS